MMTLRSLLLAAALLAPNAAFAQTTPPPYAVPGEEKVAPYTPGPANAEAAPFRGDGMARAFHGQDGIHRVVKTMLDRAMDDKVIGEIFKGHDRVRLERTIFEQFCYILNAGCTYSGRDMKASHKDLGIQHADMSRLVELLQAAMRDEHIGFRAQNRFLAKLAPMRGHVVER
jgi:hemoglobin